MSQHTMIHGITDFRITPIEEHRHDDGDRCDVITIAVKNRHGEKLQFTFFLEQAIAKVKGETEESGAETKVIDLKTVYGELR